MKRKIIIPAAGNAVRFGGLPKELLPISETDCSLTHAVRLANSIGADAVVITNPIKEPWHHRVLARAGLEAEIRVRFNPSRKDLWGSIELGLALQEPCAGGVILADTVAQIEADNLNFSSFLQFGVFETRRPDRFSILLPDRIATKEPSPPGNQAWGMVLWEAPVAEFMIAQEIEHYDRAFELAMKTFRHELFKLASYHDLGSFEAYRDFLDGGLKASLQDANEICRTSYQIACRNGKETGWAAHKKQLEESLKRQHAVLHPNQQPIPLHVKI